jgi:hypothetical protein
VLLHTYPTGERKPTYYTQIHSYWPDTQFRLEVYPQGILTKLRKFLGMEDIQTGSADFDHQYVISGGDPDAVRRFLNYHVRLAIQQLRASGRTDDIYVSLVRGHFLVRKQRPIDDYEELQQVTDLALQLYEQALLTRTDGITFVERVLLTGADGITFIEQEASFSLDEAICRICGEPVTGEAAVCCRCQTPHHRECWRYYGTCSTYGCGETKHLAPKKESPRAAKRAW